MFKKSKENKQIQKTNHIINGETKNATERVGNFMGFEIYNLIDSEPNKKKKENNIIENIELNSNKSEINKDEVIAMNPFLKDFYIMHNLSELNKDDKKDEKNENNLLRESVNSTSSNGSFLRKRSKSRFTSLFKEMEKNNLELNKINENEEIEKQIEKPHSKSLGANSFINKIYKKNIIENKKNEENEVENILENDGINYLKCSINSIISNRVTSDTNNRNSILDKSFCLENNIYYSDNNKLIFTPNNNSINNNLDESASKNQDIKELKEDLVVHIHKVISLEDKRTTFMIKNIPNKFSRARLLNIINEHCRGTYDLFILPTDPNDYKNYGYGFINFTSIYYMPYFYFLMNGKKWSGTNSIKVCDITYSKIQGKNDLLCHYPNKIIFFNEESSNVSKEQKYILPISYIDFFKCKFPKQKIELHDFYFLTQMPILD